MEKQILLALVILGLVISVIMAGVITISSSGEEYNLESAQGKVSFYVKGNPEPQTGEAIVKFNVIK